ncbi:MAG: prephenate/arogenate dehydrogenase [Limnospira sp.]
MNIGIVGLGLIGGSLGLDLRSLGADSAENAAPEGYRKPGRVLGVSRRRSTCDRAVALGAVDEADADLSLMAQADLIFICTPLSAIAPTVEQLVDHLKPNAILTDVGSVKTPVVRTLSPLWPNFVGGHPMAGTAESGIEAAQFHLFAGRPYVVTPTETTPPAAVREVVAIAEALRSRVYSCSPEAHDRAVAWISHLPVMVSAALVASVAGETDPEVLDLARKLASSGFRDTSRVGGGNPELGVMMAKYNREAVVRSLHTYRQTLDEIADAVVREDWGELERYLTDTQKARSQFNL